MPFFLPRPSYRTERLKIPPLQPAKLSPIIQSSDTCVRGALTSREPRSLKRQASLATSQQPAALPPQQNAAYQARPFKENPGQNLVRTPSADGEPAAEDKASLPGIGGTEQEPVEWAKVMLAARVHSEASVSSPTVAYYRPGTELQVVKRENGWLQLLDLVTQERGWVFEKYLSSIDGPSPTQAAMESTTENGISEPLPAKPALPRSKHRARPAAPALQVSEDVVVTESDPRSGRWARRGDRRRGIGLFMLGPSARF